MKINYSFSLVTGDGSKVILLGTDSSIYYTAFDIIHKGEQFVTLSIGRLIQYMSFWDFISSQDIVLISYLSIKISTDKISSTFCCL